MQPTTQTAIFRQEIDALPADDGHEIIDNFDADASLDTNILISMYCAYKSNYKEISADGLISVIKKHKGNLFTWSKSVKEVDGKQKHTYTVLFAGSDYFATKVFKLDEEKGTLARNYAENLIIFLNERDNETVSGNSTHQSITDMLREESSVHITGDYAAVITNWKRFVTSEFGYRIHPITKNRKFHAGIDIGVPIGTPIYAMADGTVLYVKKSTTGYGYHLVISHGGKMTTLYAHCSELLVSGGQAVKKGDVVAKVGSTGLSTGPHLHLEVMVGGMLQNPRRYLP
ncbi:MAG: M23 family metallopeptidase [Oscillospiraceae bacterium]|nr:M23 family metallopeptidase [Oscillospiraceae bacterium]